MTPLAHRLARNVLAGGPHFSAEDIHMIDVIKAALSGSRFFEVSEVQALVDDTFAAYNKVTKAGDVFTPATFLPAKQCWIEWRSNVTGRRCALCIVSIDDKHRRNNAVSGNRRWGDHI
jgi:hypothetical protein